MENIIAFMNDNGPVVLAVIGAASIIANATPNKTDNKIVAGLNKIVGFLAINFNVKGLLNK